MNKLDLLVTNKIKLESKEEKNINLDIVDLLYSIYKNNLVYDTNNFNYINKDKVIVSKSLENIYEKIMQCFYKGEVSYEYKNVHDIYSLSLGLAIGNRYLDALVKANIPKCNLISNRIICISKYDDLLSSNAFDSICYVNKEKLNKVIYIVVKDNFDTCKEDLVDRFSFLNYTIEEINGISKLGNILEDAKTSKQPTIIFVNLKTSKTINDTKESVNKSDIINEVNKRLNKELSKWAVIKETALKNSNVKDIINFLENKKININYKAANIKIEDNYEERISQSNQKIFNLLVAKNPYILNLTNNKIVTIPKGGIMAKETPSARNIIDVNNLTLLSNMGIGLAYLGFKVFISTNLDNYPNILDSMLVSSINNLDIHYTLLEDKNSINYIDSFNFINNLITFRPCDINEVIGVYEVLKEYRKPTITFISNEKVKAVVGTNYKYVQAGCYPVKKETDSVNGILIASGFNVGYAASLANTLASIGVILRVVSMPSIKVFDMQTEKYHNMLLPNTKIFILDMYNTSNYKKFIKNNEYIINSNNIEDVKRKIIELMQSK